MARILIAEDTPANLELVRYLLEAFGHEALISRDGAEAVTVARSKRPDLVLMDLLMPNMDGFEALAALRADPELEDIPVVALTALTLESDRDRAMEAGFDDFYPKPIDPTRFEEDVRRFLERGRRADPGQHE